MSRTAVVICPGRGSYNAPDLGYLQRHHRGQAEFVASLDARRRTLGQTTLSDLDAAPHYREEVHTRGDNASALIYAATLCDAGALAEDIEIVGVTGNSMGWYSALAVAGAVDALSGFEIVNTMGTLMQERLIGGQSLYPFVDGDWRALAGLRQDLLALVAEIDARPEHDLAVSIHLGGMLVVAGNAAGLEAFEAGVTPRDGRYPMRLGNHAAFHTALQAPVAETGRARLPMSLFATPRLPMVDGRGALWWPKACTAASLRDYTLGAQVTETYDFTRAVQVAARTFAPDLFILTGPGNSLGSAVAQALIAIGWRGLDGKEAFQARQRRAPLLLSMSRAEDRRRATSSLA